VLKAAGTGGNSEVCHFTNGEVAMFEIFTNNKRKLVKQVRQNEKDARQALRLTWQGNERAYTTAILLYEPAGGLLP
jgi:hypothetical protein